MQIELNVIDLTDKLKSSLEDVKLMKDNKKKKVDIEDFLNELQSYTEIGLSLGDNLYKVRVKNSNNTKGKSSGYRVIYYLIDENFEIYLLTIYSKNKIENIRKEELLNILNKIRNND